MDILSLIKEYETMCEQGLISREEFKQKRSQLLKNIDKDPSVQDNNTVVSVYKEYIGKLQNGSGVLIEKVELFKENDTGKVWAKVGFRSLNIRPVKAMMINIRAFDTWGNETTGISDYQLLDLRTSMNSVFGQDNKIYLPDDNTRRIDVAITKVYYEDGKRIDVDEEFVEVPKAILLEDYCKDSEIAEQYRKETSKKSIYVPQENEKIWCCSCGTVNPLTYSKCRLCNIDKKQIFDTLNISKLGLNVKREKTYIEAGRLASSGTILGYREAEKKYRSIIEYKDALPLAEQCLKKAEVAEKDKIIKDAKAQMRTNKIQAFKTAIRMLTPISDWKDAESLIKSCNESITQIEQKEKARKEAEERRKEEEKKRREEEKRRMEERLLKRKRMHELLFNVCCIGAAFFLIFLMGKNIWEEKIYPSKKYDKAVSLLEEKNYSLAFKEFENLDDYKDSREKCKEVYYREACDTKDPYKAYGIFSEINEYKDSRNKMKDLIPEINAAAKEGDSFFIGSYEQDNDLSNGNEYIEWTVLKKTDKEILLLSKYALDCLPYNFVDTDITWEKSTLREWLNTSFYEKAFSEEEKERIIMSSVTAETNPYYGFVPAGKNTKDKVFLLSTKESAALFTSNEDRKCLATPYAVERGAYILSNSVNNSDNTCCWWLRSPGKDTKKAAAVSAMGKCDNISQSIYQNDNAIRPAIRIKTA